MISFVTVLGPKYLSIDVLHVILLSFLFLRRRLNTFVSQSFHIVNAFVTTSILSIAQISDLSNDIKHIGKKGRKGEKKQGVKISEETDSRNFAESLLSSEVANKASTTAAVVAVVDCNSCKKDKINKKELIRWYDETARDGKNVLCHPQLNQFTKECISKFNRLL